ncbi:hypothetical protein [Nocardioides lijunqiniae]|uniref:hypothetical protein n=1 Tax=Nocardioides lijunqiniae TaxID=2760832 RepID=UPI00187766EB|nr:hypothetical protein [Nocardioides lijunqiniae]
MSDSETTPSDHDDAVGVSDDKLPEDLQPGEDNPLAEGLDDNETVEGLLDGGKDAEQLGEDGTTAGSEESQEG